MNTYNITNTTATGDSTIHMDDMHAKFFELLKSSEERIDRTNDMVCKLSGVIDDNQKMLKNITKEYCKHIAEVEDSRNAIMEQNNRLIAQNNLLLEKIAEQEKKYEETTARYQQLLERLVSSVNNGPTFNYPK